MYLCTSVGTSVSLQEVRRYVLGSSVIFTLAKPTRSNAKIYMFFFFSWGTFSLWVHREVLEDDRSEGCWALGVFFLSFLVFFLLFFFLHVLVRY